MSSGRALVVVLVAEDAGDGGPGDAGPGGDESRDDEGQSGSADADD